MSAAPPPITTIAAMTPTMTKMIVLLLLLPLSSLAGVLTFGVSVVLGAGEPLVADVGAGVASNVGWMAGFGT